MAFKCPYCEGKHDTVSEARQCFSNNGTVTTKKRPEIFTNLSDGQQSYLGDLLGQFYLTLDGEVTVQTIGYVDGKRILDGLIDARRLKTMDRPFSFPPGVSMMPHPPKAKERTPTRPPLPDVPDGRYAIPDETGNNDLRFYRVKHGKKAGQIFVDEIIGGHVDQAVSYKASRPILQAILDLGPDVAGILYSQETKDCYNCGIHLTKMASRELCLGPDCADAKGLGEEWRALDVKFNHRSCED